MVGTKDKLIQGKKAPFINFEKPHGTNGALGLLEPKVIKKIN